MSTLLAPATGLKAGPKAAVLSVGLDLSDAPPKGHRRAVWFAKTYLRVTKGHNAGKPFAYLPFQREICQGVFPSGKGKRPSQGLVQIARANGKSAFAATLALYALFADEVEGAQVLIIASDLRQASIIFNFARRMIELSPELLSRCKIYHDRIVTPFNDGILQVLPGDNADSLQGWGPSFAIIDELHVVKRENYEAILLSAGKMPDSTVLSISTPAMLSESVMWDLVQFGRQNTDPDFYFKEYTSDQTHPIDCQHCVESANPAYGKFLTRKSMDSTRMTTHPDAYRVYRLAQWLDKKSDSWLGKTQVEAVLTDERIPDGARVVLAVDGSYTGDSTVLTAVTIATPHRAQIIRAWQPHLDTSGERVSTAEVEQEIRNACTSFDVAEVAWDRFGWERSMQVLEAEGYTISEYPQVPTRMSPATISAYESVAVEAVEIVRDDVFIRHLLNARVVIDNRGTKIAKADKKSKDKIDAAITFIIGLDRANHYATQKPRRARIVSFK